MTNADAALLYVKLGWHVFPIRAGDKRPLTEHGLHDATTDVGIIQRWWERWPDASIGVRTGVESGIWALDVDVKKNGERTLFDLTAYHGALPDTAVAQTGGGGQHIIFKHPGERVKNSVDSLGLGLDVRGDGGYIVVAPSLHESGKRYAWITPPSTTPLAGAPEWLLRQVLSPVRTATTAIPSGGNPLHSTDIISEGGRNNALTRIAGIVRANGGDEEVIYQTLAGVNAARVRPQLSDDELRTIARSIGSKPAGPPLVETYGGDDPYAVAPDTRPIIPNSERPPEETDLGNAKRMRDRHGNNLRYVKAWGKWLVWQGTHWQVSDNAHAERLAIETVEAIKGEAVAIQREFDQVTAELQRETQEAVNNNNANVSRLKSLRVSAAVLEARTAALFKHARDAQSDRSIRAMVKLCSYMPEIDIPSSALDHNPFLLNCANGTLDLRSGELRPHERLDLLTRCTNVHYDPNATCPGWEAFLTEIMLGSTDLVSYLQRAVGYSLTGSVGNQCLFFLHGDGRNGKSTFVNILKELLGPYAGVGAPTLLEEGDRHPTEIAALFGRRMVIITETEDNKALPQAQIKRLTSEEPISTRRMREDFWEFSPTHKLWISGNNKPTVKGTDLGIWRRIQLVPFKFTVPAGSEDRTLGETLLRELPGIFAWAVIGCKAWLAGGLQPPAEVVNATQDYRDDEDVIGNFLEDRTERAPDAFAASLQLYGAYTTWAEQCGFKPVNVKIFKRRMESAGFPFKRLRTANGYSGIKLRSGGLQEVK